MTTNQMTTTTCLATEYGAYGPYQVGIEYTVDADLVHHAVRRPVARRYAIGYGLTPDGVGQAIERISHDGVMSEWRIRRTGAARLEVVERISNPPLLSLPDEEHGNVWGDAVDVVTDEPVRYIWCGREIGEDEARRAIAAFTAAHPNEQRGGGVDVVQPIVRGEW